MRAKFLKFLGFEITGVSVKQPPLLISRTAVYEAHILKKSFSGSNLRPYRA